jgi:hypothetical protein
VLAERGAALRSADQRRPALDAPIAGAQIAMQRTPLDLVPRSPAMDDHTILDRITALVEEERRLRDDASAPEQKAERLKQIGEQLDQYWDLLRQRRARREFGEDPDGAMPRDIGTVENYTN